MRPSRFPLFAPVRGVRVHACAEHKESPADRAYRRGVPAPACAGSTAGIVLRAIKESPRAKNAVIILAGDRATTLSQTEI